MADTKGITTEKSSTLNLNPTPEEIQAFKRRQVEIADRSFLNDRLNVNLPEGLHGEWVGRDDFSQYQAQSKGFIDGTEYLGQFNKLYETSDGKSAVGDVTFMVIPKWKQEAYEQHNALVAARKSGLNPEYVSKMEEQYAQELGLKKFPDNTTARVIDGNELNSLLKG